jgi:hypothetical protein
VHLYQPLPTEVIVDELVEYEPVIPFCVTVPFVKSNVAATYPDPLEYERLKYC